MEPLDVDVDFIAAGGNRNPSAADWDEVTGLIAFGAGWNVAIWNPSDPKGIRALLAGHTDVVNAVRFLPGSESSGTFLLSGSADRTIRIWKNEHAKSWSNRFENIGCLESHSSSVTCIAVAPAFDGFVSGASDGTVNVWKWTHSGESNSPQPTQKLNLRPKFIPLAIAVACLTDDSHVMAVAGTKSTIQIYKDANCYGDWSQIASLSGHEGWIRSLAFTKETHDNSDLILASASQDKYIRLWRIHQGEEMPAASSAASDPALGVLGRSVSNKPHRFEVAHMKYSITFEALLLGHEDWIYTVSWKRWNDTLQLVSASADNSLAVWQSDAQSGVWVPMARLGEVSAQKGATTATGSTGGFWIGLWSPSGDRVASLGRTGSWRVWARTDVEDAWTQQFAITGHTKQVKSIAWSKSGTYLLTTASDQTTRLFAEWKKVDQPSWHEFSRPQIHGYDLNCIAAVTDTQFISGADEKLLRVFDEPNAVAELLQHLCDITKNDQSSLAVLPDAANIPVLGLSNKAISAADDGAVLPTGEDDEREAPNSGSNKFTLNMDQPPLEDHLSRHMLWPEREKLYGHGYEISAVAASHDGSLVATACRASSIDHAVIRLYETTSWREVKPALKAHSLTVHNLSFSPDDKYLLSVGRDRQWTIFERALEDTDIYVQKFSDLKGHSRMILDCTWAPLGPPEKNRIFVTAGRDKLIKIWEMDNAVASAVSKIAITAAAPVTAVDSMPFAFHQHFLLAYATEDGEISICAVDSTVLTVSKKFTLSREIQPSACVSKLAWRPLPPDSPGADIVHLAVGSDDTAVRLFSMASQSLLGS